MIKQDEVFVQIPERAGTEKSAVKSSEPSVNPKKPERATR
jgi:hypothetical protein